MSNDFNKDEKTMLGAMTMKNTPLKLGHYSKPHRLPAYSVIMITALSFAPFSRHALAEAVETAPTIRLQTLTVEGNALYEMPASESTQGYSVDSATVGTKTPAALRDIPQSITVLTNDYIEDRGFINLDDAAKYTPGLRTLSNDSGRSSIFSRGYEYDEYNIDGLPAPMQSINGTLPSLSAFDRVEIMRGPSGLFNSTSELGGIINLVRKRPTYDTQGSLSASYGSWGRYNLEADVAGALNTSESVRGRLVASQTDNQNEIDQNTNDDQSFYGTLDIDLDESTLLSIGALHQTKSITPANGFPAYSDGTLIDWDRSTFLGSDWNDFDAETTDLFFDLTHQFDNGGYGRVAVRSSKRDTEYYYTYTGSAIDSDGNTRLSSTQRDYSQTTLSADASYSQPFSAMGQVNEFVVGTDYKNYDTDYRNGASSLGTININSFDSSDVAYTAPTYSTRVESEEQEIGLYGKVTLRPTERLALISGGRFSWYDLDNSTTTLSSGATTHSDYNDSAHFTPYAGVVFDLNEAHSLYASYSEVFKPQTDTDENGDMIDPREGQQIELGIKGSYLGGDINSRLSVFQLTDKNRSATPYDSDGNAITDYSEATGKTRVTGFEAEVSGSINNWDLLAGYSYMDTENLSGDDNSLFMLMPRHTLSLWSTYNLTHGQLNGLSLGAGVTGMSEFYLERAGTRLTAPGYAVVDAKVGYEVNDQLSLSLNINNLFDRKYYSRVGSVATFNFYGPSRNVMAGLTYQF
ncbi:TonB-dependent siderophore receptor [Neptunomonas phycophila]|uniref:TonB-dependent siderophore receptor n=2 Tax=Gammaproteobacteria TaxID=1236 RepID=A0AAW7XH38_9GAMM|nr:TonB-dependent siderophore receptor [Neptunomonas phycophila]MDO6453482.1 TonB-dependent siderophore receptor [Neptunomonas phycophila]